MKIKVSELLKAQSVFGKIFEQKMPIVTCMMLQKSLDKVDAELSAYESAKNKLFETLGENEVDKEGNKTGRKFIPEKNLAEFEKEIKSLHDAEFEFSDSDKIDFDYCLKDKIELNSIETKQIRKFITEPRVDSPCPQ